MAIPNRTDIRERWVALVTATGTWRAVYDHQPATFNGVSGVATVHGGPFGQEEVVFGDGEPDVVVTLLHTNYARRDDPDVAEDEMDALLVATAQLAADNQKDGSGNWHELRLLDTEPDYYVVDGQQYRAEQIRLEFKIYL